MGLTVSQIREPALMSNGLKLVMVEITFDSSYPTNGEALAASDCGLVYIWGLFPEPVAHAGTVIVPIYDPTTRKLKAFDSTAAHTHTENAAGSYTQNATTTASSVAQPSEVANTTDLSTAKVRCIVIGV